MPDTPVDCLTLRRPLDGLTYLFRRQADGAFVRDDQPTLSIRHHPGLGWTMHDPQTGALTGRPWDETQRHAPGQPAEGVWVSRKGAKSHVYELTHGAPPAPDGGRVRAAWAGDLAAIAAFDEFNGERAAEVAAASCLVALDAAGQVAGYASWTSRGLLGQPFLATLCVRPDARRQGHASALLQAVPQRAPGRWLLSSTEDWCTPMQTLFERLGWQRCGALEGINRDGSPEWFYRVAITAPGST
jgi:GNAT superfamily N-acetyltransferase